MCFRGSEGEAAWIHHVLMWHQSQPQKNHGHLQHGPYTQCQGCIEDHRLFGQPEPVNLSTRQMRDASLQTSQEDRSIRLDKGGTVGFGKPQSIADIGTNPRRSRMGRIPPPLHRDKQPCCERRPCRREGGAGTPLEGPMTGVLHR